MERRENILTVVPGCISLNGSKVHCVTDFKYECIGKGLAHVTLAFDIPVKKTTLTNQDGGIRIPVTVDGELIEELVLGSDDEEGLSRRELLELAKIGVEDEIRSAAALRMDKYFDRVLELSEKRRVITDELAAITGEQQDGEA